MTNNDDIVFDANSGISIEEQRDILSKINGIAEKNRRSLSQGGAAETGKKERFKAKKNGGLFPVLVNAAALVSLAGGFFLLASFQGKTEIQAREGTNVYTSAERALIDEIRRETETKIALKEKEIALIVSRLEGVDAELKALYSSREELTSEQQTAESGLLSLQDEYLADLAALQDERSKILEESRAREAALRVQLELRTKELAAVSQQSSAELDSARSELERLANEQEKASAIEAYLSGGLASVHDLLRKNRFSEALETLKNLRLFLNTPAFQAIRSIQTKKEFYTQAFYSMEAAVEEARKNQAGVSSPSVDANTEKILADLQIKNTRLEENIADMNKTIAAFSSGSSDQARRLTELQNTVDTLQYEKNALQYEKNDLETSVADRDRTIRARNNTITRIQETVQGKAVADMTITELNENLSKIIDALENWQN